MSTLNYTHEQSDNFQNIENIYSVFLTAKKLIGSSDNNLIQQVPDLVYVGCSVSESVTSPSKLLDSIFQMIIGLHTIIIHGITPTLYQISILPIVDEILLRLSDVKSNFFK